MRVRGEPSRTVHSELTGNSAVLDFTLAQPCDRLLVALAPERLLGEAERVVELDDRVRLLRQGFKVGDRLRKLDRVACGRLGGERGGRTGQGGDEC